MTAADRQKVREAIDRRARKRTLGINRSLAGIMFCTGCGMEFDQWTPGCRTCNDRWHRWKKEGKVHPDVYRYQRDLSREYGHRRRTETIAALEHHPLEGRRPTSTWAEHREALGVRNGGRLVATPRGLI